MRAVLVLVVIGVLATPGVVTPAFTPTATPNDLAPSDLDEQTPTVDATPADAATASAPEQPRIVALYPNPYRRLDRGEFIVLEVPPDTDLGGLTLTDGKTVARLPNRTVSGRVALAIDRAARNVTDAPVYLLDARLQLANRGDRLELRRGTTLLDTVTYRNAPEGYLYRRMAAGWEWHRLGATAFPVRSARATEVRVFVLPDAPEAALAPIRAAHRRVWLAGYTLTSSRVTAALCTARSRGVAVRVLIELEPVGGMTATGAQLLDRLVACGVEVRAIGGPRGRYAFHHAKYAVADDHAVVLTENWKPSGVGGRSSRGWGVVVASPAVADTLAETFRADAEWRDARPWVEARDGRTFDRTEPPANGSYAPTFTPTAATDVGIEVLVAPENAEARTVALLDRAESSIRVVQVSVGGRDQPFVRGLLRAARRGVEVRLLLADVWYVREHNQAVAAELEGLARSEGLPLQVRLASPRGRYGKIHAKGAVVDGERVLVGSLNWNNASARRNREVALVLHSGVIGAYFERVFDADWQGGRWRVPAGLLAVAAVLAVAAGAFAVRSIEFETTDEAGVEPEPIEDENLWAF